MYQRGKSCAAYFYPHRNKQGFHTFSSLMVAYDQRALGTIEGKRHQYFTFLTEEACGCLKDYLEERARQKIIAVKEIERYPAEGWEYVASISNDKAIIEMPF